VSFGPYVLGCWIAIGGLTYGAALMHVPTRWITVAAMVPAGLGLVTGVKARRQKGSAN
jgi:hypothetical protein